MSKINHKYTAKPWKTPIDDPIYFEVELLLYRENKLLIILKDERNNQKYSLQVHNKVHIRNIPDRFRYSIWNHSEWIKLVEHEYTCPLLENSNFQLSLIGAKNMLNYFLICDVEVFEILSASEPLILPVENDVIRKLVLNFLNDEDICHHKNDILNKKEKFKNKEKHKNHSGFDSIIKNAVLHFEFASYSREEVNFIVTDCASKQHYRITIPFISTFQCIQSPDHSKDYDLINLVTKDLKIPSSPLWKLKSSQLQDETIDLGLFYDSNDFGSLYIKTNNVEVECVTQEAPQISLLNQKLLEFGEALNPLKRVSF